jgi:5-methylcytosine-specific restriction endonuclease McrA
MSPEINREPKHRIPVGMTAYDGKKESYTRMVMINYPDQSCDEFQVPGTGKTAAEFNPEYDPDLPVVQTVYRFRLDQELENWMSRPPSEIEAAAKAAGLKIYSYPSKRLKSSFCHVPDRVETYRELLCYQAARMTHLAVTIKNDEQLTDFLLWKNYERRVDGEVQMSSILKENQYQMKENIGICTYCNQESKTTFDHIIPVDADGDDTMDNMVPVCKSCNSSKSNKNILEWHQEHEIPIDRIALGKYIKLRWDELSDEGRLDNPLPDSVRDRWEHLEVTRNISQTLSIDARKYE